MRTVKFIFLGIVIIALAILSYFLFGNYSEGNRAGTIAKLSRRGVLIKTYEGQLNIGGISTDGSHTSPLWDFSVSNGEKEVIKQLEDAALTGDHVKLYYKEKFYTLSWRGETKYFVYKVETAPNHGNRTQ
ncbi:hypothetical protein GXP67_18190 [Rhodocytophaga rosea]|uniref:6-phosphogluconate dehydrogenase n=1 Tax=Rhodocytophaga rosea TaxID=2704465 RepID=A0A6C0GKU6_9BACT|nr:hypothetical protein [Rhodocytophaga rosea]QHT68434.1 hypothetical protein GXP67_18190 [Rhodocytophaga rosea]